MSEAFRDHYTLLARYNAWANETLYGAIASLPAQEIAAPRGAFFGSMLGTLNHILVGDNIWIGRLTGRDSGMTSLDQTLHTDFAALYDARRAFDAVIAETMETVPLDGDLEYRNMAGQDNRTPRLIVLTHIFNHQTHHRGQVHNMLSQTGMEPPPLDILYFPR